MTRNDCAQFLLQHDNYAILTHRRPDGDTLGSAAALCRMLRKKGKTAHILRNPEITDRFAWLHDGLTKEEAAENDTIVTVDIASAQLLPAVHRKYLDRIALRIDHHASSTPYAEHELVDPASAACGELICDLLSAMDHGEMEPELADAIYVAISTDTGCFRFANTTGRTFSCAAACASGGARVYELNQALFETNTLGRLKMQAWIVTHMDVFAEGKMAVVAIPGTIERHIGVTEDDMDNISSFPRTVAGVEMAATLRETTDGAIKLSVRAIPGRDATAVTEKFGGGGHRGAAGATLNMTLSEAAAAVKQALLEAME